MIDQTLSCDTPSLMLGFCYEVDALQEQEQEQEQSCMEPSNLRLTTFLMFSSRKSITFICKYLSFSFNKIFKDLIILTICWKRQ